MSATIAGSIARPSIAPHRRLGARLGEFCIAALLLICVTTPGIPVSDDLRIKPEAFVVPLILIVYLWMLSAGLAKPFRANGLFLIGAIFFVCMCVSMVYGAAFLHHRVIQRDFYELVKIWLPVIFYTIGYETDIPEQGFRRLLKVMSVGVVFACIYAYAQYLNLPFTFKMNEYYSGGVHIDLSLYNYRRAFSTMGNPNVLGQLMTFTIIAYTMAAIYNVGNRIWNMTLVVMCLVALVMCGSRYGLLETGLGLLMIFFTTSPADRKRFGRLGLLLLLLPLFAWISGAVAQRNQTTVQRFEALQHPLEVDSLRERMDDLWQSATQDYLRSPVLGHGPAKSVFTGVLVDSEFLETLKYYGIVGFIPYLGYFFFPLYVIRKGLRECKQAGAWLEEYRPSTLMILRFSFILTVLTILMNVGMATFFNLTLQGFVWVWMGIGASAARALHEYLHKGRIASAECMQTVRLAGS